MGILDGVLGLFTGGGSQQAAPGTQTGASGGVSPLAQSLLAGYFSAIGSPKLSGIGGAISRGGLTALDQYNNANYAQSMEDYRRAQAQKAGGLVATPEQRIAAGASIREMAKDMKGPQAAAIHQLAAGVEAGVMDPDDAYKQAVEVVKSASQVHMGILGSGQPVLQRGEDVWAPWQGGQSDNRQGMGQPPQQLGQPQPQVAPTQQAQPQAPGQAAPQGDIGNIFIPESDTAAAQEFVRSMIAKGYSEEAVMGELAKIYGGH